MRTAIRDVAEGADMGLETGSVPGLSCSLYGGVDFGEDYREVTGKSAVPEKLYVYVVPSEIRSLLKSWKTSFGRDRKSTRLNSSHVKISYAVFCLKKKRNKQ